MVGSCSSRLGGGGGSSRRGGGGGPLVLLLVLLFSHEAHAVGANDDGDPWPGRKCSVNPSGIDDPSALLRPAACLENWATLDPRVFGPHLWKSFHMIAANFPCPPTQKAVEACTNFTYALPYMLPCSHCGAHLAKFIETNINLSNTVADECMGARINEKGEDESLCLSPELACTSQRSFSSFFVRAHNAVNAHTHPCQSRWTTDQALEEYKTLKGQFCPTNIVWGDSEICRGYYCGEGTGAPKHECSCDLSGPVGSGGEYATTSTHMSGCYDGSEDFSSAAAATEDVEAALALGEPAPRAQSVGGWVAASISPALVMGVLGVAVGYAAGTSVRHMRMA